MLRHFLEIIATAHNDEIEYVPQMNDLYNCSHIWPKQDWDILICLSKRIQCHLKRCMTMNDKSSCCITACMDKNCKAEDFRTCMRHCYIWHWNTIQWIILQFIKCWNTHKPYLTWMRSIKKQYSNCTKKLMKLTVVYIYIYIWNFLSELLLNFRKQKKERSTKQASSYFILSMI